MFPIISLINIWLFSISFLFDLICAHVLKALHLDKYVRLFRQSFSFFLSFPTSQLLQFYFLQTKYPWIFHINIFSNRLLAASDKLDSPILIILSAVSLVRSRVSGVLRARTHVYTISFYSPRTGGRSEIKCCLVTDLSQISLSIWRRFVRF